MLNISDGSRAFWLRAGIVTFAGEAGGPDVGNGREGKTDLCQLLGHVHGDPAVQDFLSVKLVT